MAFAPGNNSSPTPGQRPSLDVLVDGFATFSQPGKTAHLPSSSTPTHAEWNPITYRADALLACPKFSRTTLANAKKHALNFLKFYAGTVISVSDLTSTMKELWAAMKFGEQYLFSDSLFDDNATSLSPLQTLEAPALSAWKFFVESASGNSIASVPKVNVAGRALEVTNSMVNNWYNNLVLILEETSDSRSQPEVSPQQAVNYLGYLAMVSARLCIKDPIQVTRYIVSNTYSRLHSITRIGDLGQGGQYVVPMDSSSMEFLALNFKKGSEAFPKLLHMVTEGFCQASDTQSGVFKSAIILSIALTGMAPYSWWVKCKQTLKLSPGDLAGCFAAPRYMSYLLCIHEFETLCYNPKADPRWIFARLYSDNVWANYAIQQLSEGTLLAAALSEKGNRAAAIWGSPSLQKFGSQSRDQACDLAMMIISVLYAAESENAKEGSTIQKALRLQANNTASGGAYRDRRRYGFEEAEPMDEDESDTPSEGDQEIIT
ncbi:hypothetical protein DMENIID0001_012800 [Sergentomyia squamirostris]